MDAKKVSKTRELRIESGRKFSIRWIAVALVLLVLIAAGAYFILRSNKATVYETFVGEQRTFELLDGSMVTLKPGTRIEIAGNYNQTNRRIKMQSGEAFFDVIYVESKPFLVGLGSIQVKDIGSSFTIVKNEMEIKLAVETGKAELADLDNKVLKELPAGTSIVYDIRTKTFGKVLSDAKIPK